MRRIGEWWRRLTGREAAAPPASRPKPGTSKPDEATGAGELKLVDGPAAKKPSRTAEAGFDPYASDAGCAKPHSWERIDHD